MRIWTMDQASTVTVEVRQIKLNDVYTPLDYNRQNVVRWTVAAVIAYAVYDVCFAPGNRMTGLPDSGSISAVLVTLAVFIVLGLVLFPYLRLASLMRKVPGFRKPIKFVFSAEGLRFVSEDANGECKWSVFIQAIETRKSFVFSQTGHGGTYIPKRFFSSPADILSLRQLICENFKGKRTLRRD